MEEKEEDIWKTEGKGLKKHQCEGLKPCAKNGWVDGIYVFASFSSWVHRPLKGSRLSCLSHSLFPRRFEESGHRGKKAGSGTGFGVHEKERKGNGLYIHRQKKELVS